MIAASYICFMLAAIFGGIALKAAYDLIIHRRKMAIRDGFRIVAFVNGKPITAAFIVMTIPKAREYD
nr:MAG TPA: hypothetical protein [Caudoviricetes sp.]